jgi:hypothetical protein
MPMPLKMTSYEIPSYVLHHFIIPYAEQCYLVSIEYHYVNWGKLLIILLKKCSSVSGVVHINLNNIVDDLIKRYEIFDANREWLVQVAVQLIYRELQSYFCHRAELSLAQRNR